MKIRRTTMAIVAAGALVLSACTSDDGENGDGNGDNGDNGTEEPTDDNGDDNGDDDDDDDPTGEPGEEPSADAEPYHWLEAPAPGEEGYTGKLDLGSVTTADTSIAYSVGGDAYAGYNGSLQETNSVSNSVINARVASSFWYYGTDGTVYPNTEFGTYQMTSEDPQVIEYTISDEAVWEDGTEITYNDFVVAWATANPPALWEYEDGSPSGPFNNISPTYGNLVAEGPQGDVGGKTFTVEYTNPYPDWRLTVGGGTPAHVLAEQSGLTVEELVEAIQERDSDTVAEIADFWNNEWVFGDMELPDASLIPASGPYSLATADWFGDEYMTLTVNEQWWGTPPATANLTFRFQEPSTHVQSLENRDLHVIEPQATIDTMGDLENLGDSIEIQIGEVFTYEHLDFNFTEGDADEGIPASPFADSEGGIDAREAFALCVPRDTILNNLILPVQDDAVLLDARERFPFQEGYEEYVADIYDGRYDSADLDAARAAFEASGLDEGTEVRIGYGAGNERRTSTVQLIKESCDQVGFDIQDAAAPQLGEVLSSGNWEIALFAWAGSGVLTGGSFWYVPDGGGNYGDYRNPQMREAWDIIEASLDTDVHEEQLKIIETLAWDELHSIPIYAHPGVVAHDSSLTGIVQTATQTQVVWNAEQWGFE